MGISDLLFNKKKHEFGSNEAINYSKYLGKANDEIKIVAGELYAPYYSNEHVLENIMSAIENGANIKIIFGPAVYIECRDILKQADKGKIELFKLPVRIDQHFRVVDQQNVYCSKPHNIDTDVEKRNDELIEWSVRPSIDGEIYEDMFDELLSRYAKKVEDIIEEFKERKIEYYKTGRKKGRVKTAYGFI